MKFQTFETDQEVKEFFGLSRVKLAFQKGALYIKNDGELGAFFGERSDLKLIIEFAKEHKFVLDCELKEQYSVLID